MPKASIPDPYPLAGDGYTEDWDLSPHTQASIEKALDNRKVPATLNSILAALNTLNTKVDTTNSRLSTISGNVADIEKILDDHYNPGS